VSLFPPSFDASRTRLVGWKDRLAGWWPSVDVEDVAVGPSGEPMTVVRAQADDRDHVLILVAGLHGVEGYAGSAVIELFLREWAGDLDHQRVSVWVVHGPNPTGWITGRKTNHNNVDLNRSFVDRQTGVPANPGYDDPALRRVFEPGRPRGGAPQLAQIAGLAVAGRLGDLARSLTLGQYTSPTGLYFGGTEEPWATAWLKAAFDEGLGGWNAMTVLDLHTGYGPRNTLAVVNSRYDPVPPAQWAARLGWPLVQAADGDTFYPIHGDMTDWLTLRHRALVPDRSFWATTLEFGTWGDSLAAQVRTLRATINENAAHHRGSDRQKRSWTKELTELYAPRGRRWRQGVEDQARRLVPAILEERGLKTRRGR
jgi:hypothetical protein